MSDQGDRRNDFETAVLPHLTSLGTTARRLSRTRDGADDLVQEAVLRAWTGWDGFAPGTNVRAWLHRILFNLFLTGYRRARRASSFLNDDESRPLLACYGGETLRRARDPEAVMFQGLLTDEVERALATLPVDCRAVVALADLCGASYHEIAERLGMPLGTVMSRLFRARRALEPQLAAFAAREYGIQRRAA